MVYLSGAQGSGKSTLTKALLSHIGGRLSHGPQMREIVATAFPSSRLSQLQPVQTFAAFMLRALGRHEVSALNGIHLSDGSLLNELAFLRGRIAVGAFGAASRIQDREFSSLVDLFEEHVQRSLTLPRKQFFIHLDPELPLENDGYRPQYPAFRNFVNDYLLERYRQLDLPHICVTGSIAQRCEQARKALIEYRILHHS